MEYDITNLKGAEYNPRHIDQKQLDVLAESVSRFGIVKPLIARGDLLVAGHQRTKTLRRLGIRTAPVYALPVETNTYDEVRFNQLHNGTDMDSGDENVTVSGGFESLGYHFVDPSRIDGNYRAKMAPVRRQICQLILKYGPWGGSVATQSGRVIHCSQYALAAAITNTKLTVYVIEDSEADLYQQFLSQQYGEFSYDGIDRQTYVQTFAQMMRLRSGPSGKANKSSLYETMVKPWMVKNPDAYGIDFGSGQGDYARLLRKQGFKLHDLELFRRRGAAQVIDMASVNRMIDKMIHRLSTVGQYDYVVCDSVLNSVDSLKAESAVMAMLNVLCKPGGTIFFSGRKAERVESQLRMTRQDNQKRNVEFLDRDGFTALYRSGRWFFQKYHDAEQVERLCNRYNFAILKHERSKSSTSWQVMATKKKNISLESAISAVNFEFNLPVGDQKTIGRHGDVAEAVVGIYKNYAGESL